MEFLISIGINWAEVWLEGTWAEGVWAQEGFGGVSLSNANSTTDVPNNYEHCSRSGFRVYPDEIVRDGYGHYVRKKSYDDPHPSDHIKSVAVGKKGSPSPETADTFVTTNQVQPEDL